MPDEWERRLRSIKRTRLRDAVAGRLKVVGQLQFTTAPRLAPLSGRAVGAYHALVIARREGAPDEILVDDRWCGDATLDDGLGVALLPGKTVELVLDIDVGHAPWIDRAHPAVSALLAARGVTSNRLGGASLYGHEGVLVDGEIVVAYGDGHWEADPRAAEVADYRVAPAQRFVLGGREGERTLVSDQRELIAAGRVA